MTETKLQNLISQKEHQTLEFKESTGEKKEICETICAFANSDGGIILVGVKKDGSLSKAKITEKSQTDITDLFVNFKPKITSLISFEIFPDFDGQNILIITVQKSDSSKNFYQKTCWKRVGASNKDITEEVINQITNQNHDWSAGICEGATIDDLDEEAILKIKKLWAEKTGKQDILKFDTTRLLLDLFETDKILKATLILLGKKSSIEKFGINTEISFHYRNNLKSIRSDDRKDFRRCFALEYDEIWNKIDARNEIFYFQKGLFLEQIMKFNEIVIREALLNCIAHRDYESEYANSQIVINQSPEAIEFQNPGQLPTDTNLDKLIQTPSKPRNKKLAEVFQKLKLIEKSGFGIDLIVQKTISEGKGSPEYTNFDNHYIFLKLNANLQDEAFVRYLYKIAKEKDYSFDALEVLTLEQILLTGETDQTNIKNNLLKQGFIEISGTGKGAKLILSKKYYELSGDDRTKYTVQKGLDEESCRQIIIKHLEHFSDSKNPVLGPELYELVKKVSDISERTFHRYLKKMLEEKIIKKRFIGKSKIEYKLWNDKWKDI